MFQKFILNKPLTEDEIQIILERLKEHPAEIIRRIGLGCYMIMEKDPEIDPTFFIFEGNEVRVLSANDHNPIYEINDLIV